MLVMLHGGEPLAPHDLWTAWSWEPVAVAGILVAGAIYLAGVLNLWREAGRGRGVAAWRAWCFAAGLGTIAVALFSPVDRLGETLFAAHMIQHLLLMLVAPPLLVLGAPSWVLLWALGPPERRAVGLWWNRRPGVGRWVGRMEEPAVAWVLGVLAILVWHVPGLYRAALAHESVHALEHLSFLVTGFLFWWVVLRPDGRRRLNHGVSVLFLFTAALPGGLLGALLTFAGRPLYPGQSTAAHLWGLTPLEDQQLAGLIMWMPGGLVYLTAAAGFFLIWLNGEERKGSRATARPGLEMPADLTGAGGHGPQRNREAGLPLPAHQ